MGWIYQTGSILGGLKKIHFLYLEPLYEAMGRVLREVSHWHADESGWHLFTKLDDKGNYNWFIWVYISKEIVLFVLHPSRSGKVPCKILFDIEREEIKAIEGGFVNHREKKIMNKVRACGACFLLGTSEDKIQSRRIPFQRI